MEDDIPTIIVGRPIIPVAENWWCEKCHRENTTVRDNCSFCGWVRPLE